MNFHTSHPTPPCNVGIDFFSCIYALTIEVIWRFTLFPISFLPAKCKSSFHYKGNGGAVDCTVLPQGSLPPGTGIPPPNIPHSVIPTVPPPKIALPILNHAPKRTHTQTYHSQACHSRACHSPADHSWVHSRCSIIPCRSVAHSSVLFRSASVPHVGVPLLNVNPKRTTAEQIFIHELSKYNHSLNSRIGRF